MKELPILVMGFSFNLCTNNLKILVEVFIMIKITVKELGLDDE